MSYREYLTKLVPPWLQRAVGELFLGAHGDELDVLATKAKDATKAGFVADAPSDALRYHGRERVLPRFAGEADASHRARLVAAWDTYETAGTRAGPLSTGGTYGLVGMLEAALDPSVTVQVKAYRDPYLGPLRRGYWSEFWVVLSGVPWARRTWGDGSEWGRPAGAPRTWGSTATRAEVETLKNIVRTFKAAHEWCPAIVVAFSGRTWGDGSLWGGSGVEWDGAANAIYWPISRS